ncbi:MAG: response regulator [Anaerolineae bacterium]|nr:response regulator [Anaerolineae bacterium]
MSESGLDLDTVRWLLAHMDDRIALAGNPALAEIPSLAGAAPYDRANTIRTLLLEAMEFLRPPRRGVRQADDARAYNVLWLRYVEGMSVLQVGEELALSERQTHRELRAAEAKLAEVLTIRLAKLESAPPGVDSADQPEAIEVTARPAQVNLQSLLQDAIKTVTPLAQSVGATIRVETGQAHGSVFADEGILRQWVIQALSLGVQTTPDGEVELSSIASEGTTIAVSFHPPLVPYSREALADLRRLAEALNARFVPSGGTADPVRLSLFLPARQARPVLVIEDSAAAVELYRRYLEPQGEWRVIAADDPQRAYDLARESRPSVILLDLLMPGTDGWTILNLLHANEDTADIPVIVCSVFHDALLAKALGAKAHLRKPVSQPELLAAVNRWAR